LGLRLSCYTGPINAYEFVCGYLYTYEFVVVGAVASYLRVF